MVVVNIMLIHDLFNFLIRHVVAELGKGILEGRLRNGLLISHVKLGEEGNETVLCGELFHWEDRCDELVIVDHAIAIEVDLLNYLLQLVFVHVCVVLGHGLS